ncbi:MAG: hypothetical protein AABY22_17960 [Nanoarchaeota archaeon]
MIHIDYLVRESIKRAFNNIRKMDNVNVYSFAQEAVDIAQEMLCGNKLMQNLSSREIEDLIYPKAKEEYKLYESLSKNRTIF